MIPSSTANHSQHQAAFNPSAPRGTSENPWTREDLGTDAFKNSTPPPAPTPPPELSADEKILAAAKVIVEQPSPKVYPSTAYGDHLREQDARMDMVKGVISRVNAENE